MARLLMAALRRAGHRVELASRLRSFAGDGAGHEAIARRAGRAAGRLIARYGARPLPERPAAWFTYHLHYKAPDWIGPPVADALAIPYLAAEASHAPKRAAGQWAFGHAAAAAAIRRADALIVLNPADRACLEPLARDARTLIDMKPFVDAAQYAAPADRSALRFGMARRYGLDERRVWLLAVAMMRPGDKLLSYRLLAAALGRLPALSWQLLAVGAGAAEDEVRDAFARLRPNVVFTGALPLEELGALYAAADLFVWPAIGEAYGMALLEAQASGLPAVAGASGGVGQVLASEVSGLLAPAGNAAAFAAAVRRLIEAPDERQRMAAAARARVAAEHDIAGAARTLDEVLRRLGVAP